MKKGVCSMKSLIIVMLLCVLNVPSIRTYPTIAYRVSRLEPGSSNLLNITAYDSVSKEPLGLARFQKSSSTCGVISQFFSFGKSSTLPFEMFREIVYRLRLEGCKEIIISLQKDSNSPIPSAFFKKLGIQEEEEGYIRRGIYCIQ